MRTRRCSMTHFIWTALTNETNGVGKKWNDHNLMYIYHKQCEILQKKSLKQLKQPISVISHWFSLEMVQKVPTLYKCKRFFLFYGSWLSVDTIHSPCRNSYKPSDLGLKWTHWLRLRHTQNSSKTKLLYNINARHVHRI